MNLERDKYLTEAMGEHWHEHTMTCGYTMTRLGEYISDIKTTSYTNDFSTWAGFGKLWEWAQKQDWWEDFYQYELCEYSITTSTLCNSGTDTDHYIFDTQFINPNSFANAVYDYLKEKANDSTR